MIETLPAAVTTFIDEEGLGEITSLTLVTGGHINQTRRIITESGISFIIKQNTTQNRMFECEADGLWMLREAGMRTPEVWLFGADFLLMEDLGEQQTEPDWEVFGRAVAYQHLHTHERFGFDYNNFLGPLPQINFWTENGHEFFGLYRVLRYLDEPRCVETLTSEDRRDVEALVKRLPELVPAQPPSLLHGDLWHTNILVDLNGVPAVIDPAVYFGWAEAELSQTRLYGKVPPVFYDAYNEVNPLQPGWWDRLELLTIRQLMAVIAFFGNEFNTLQELRNVITKYR